MSGFPEELCQIRDYLNKLTDLNLPTGSGDSRRDSANAEGEIISRIQNNPSLPRIVSANIEETHNRAWYDFSTKHKGKGIYVDIKITDMEKGSADNTNCTSAIYYVLTGKHPPSSNVKIISRLANDLEENDEDFYFLVLDKHTRAKESNLKRANLFSLRTLKVVYPNGNNLPFQCKWKENLEPVDRTYAEAKNFLLNKYGESVRKRADMYFEFERKFSDIAGQLRRGKELHKQTRN